MLNAPVDEGEPGEGAEFGDLGAVGDEAAPGSYIQVTQQEKEAIERVSEHHGAGRQRSFTILNHFNVYLC